MPAKSDSMKIKNPIERRYYTLAQAAKELCCDADYLLHLGVMDELEILAMTTYGFEYIPFKGGKIQLTKKGNKASIGGKIQGAFFLGAPAKILMEIELFGESTLSHGTSIMPAIDLYAKNLDAIIKSHGNELLIKPLGSIDERQVTITNLYISGTEVSRLETSGCRAREHQKENNYFTLSHSSAGDDSPEIPISAKGKNYMLRTILALCQALPNFDLEKPKRGQQVINALAKAGIAHEIKADALDNYINEAMKLD